MNMKCLVAHLLDSALASYRILVATNLGHVINSELTDDPYVMQHTRTLYALANMII